MKNRKLVVIQICLLILALFGFGLTGFLWFVDRKLFWAALPLTLILCVLILWQFYGMQNWYKHVIQNVVDRLDTSQRQFLHNFPMPIIVTTAEREIVWYSESFRSRILTSGEIYGAPLDSITGEKLSDLCSADGRMVHCFGRYFQIFGIESDQHGSLMYTLYFFDITELQTAADLYHMTRPSVMLVMLDNYSEVMQQAKESEKSKILSDIDTTLENFISAMTTSFIKRFDGDKFLVVVEEQHLSKIIQTRFGILDEIRSIHTAGNLPVTLSIGVGRGEETLAQSEAAARQALDMALGRGGDQAAVKNKTAFEFYGGVSKGVEKRTKVKTRIVANALSELVDSADHVLLMGHKFGDLDCVGASIGLAYAIRSMGKQAEVVIDRDKNLANILLEMVSKEGSSNLFVDPDEALFGITEDTLLIICDTHTSNLVESLDVYERCKRVVVIDHHRKMVNHIDNAVIFYHEPYASSASEMVTELIQYMGDNCRINAVVAQALLSGIMLDTRNFVLKTGVRTFEAAAYLRRIGADTIAVRKLFANTMDSYQRRSRIVSAAQIYKSCAVAESDFSSDDMRIVASQAADELLGIDGVDGSFVLYEYEGGVNISARSMGAINVQVIMEQLGGGGHQTMAAAQLRDVEMEKAKQLLLEAIDEYFKNNK